MSGPRRRDGGFALLLVLWTMVLLALLGSRIASRGRTETQLAGNIRDAAITEAAADGAVQEAAFHLLDAAPRRWRADGGPHVLRQSGVQIEVRAESEAGRVNPNLASSELLTSLLLQVGSPAVQAASVAAAIVSWRFPGARNDTATIQAYRAAGRDDLPSGQPLRNAAELGFVLGMTPELLARLLPFLSFHLDGDPDPTQASPTVLRALGALAARQAGGSSGTPPVLVTAVASGPSGTRFVRRAVLRLDPAAAEPVRVLEWGSGERSNGPD